MCVACTVIPAEAGIHCHGVPRGWIPACAGVTRSGSHGMTNTTAVRGGRSKWPVSMSYRVSYG